MNFAKHQRTALLASVLLITVFILLQFVGGNESLFFVVLKAVTAVGAVICLAYAYVSKDKPFGESALSKPSQAAAAPTDEINKYYDELLDSVLRLTQSIHPKYQVAVYMIDSMHGGQVLQKASSDIFNTSIAKESKLLQLLMNEKHVSILQQKDVRDDWEDVFKKETWRGSECLLGRQIIYRGNPVGCILLFMDHFSKVNKPDKNILSVISDLISDGMERLDKISELSQRSSFEEYFSNLYSKVNLKMDVKEIWEVVLPLCRTLFSYDKLTISAEDITENQGRVNFVDGDQDAVEPGLRFALDTSLHGACITSEEYIISKYWSHDFAEKTRFDLEETSEFHYSSVLLVPFKVGEYKACLSFERISSKSFSETDIFYTKKITDVLNTLLSNRIEYKRVLKTASHDGLTGLLNHRYFQIRYEEELNRAVRFNQNFVLSILDLDKFKRINDTYGHIFGDYVIKTVGQIIRDNVRNIDVLARYGGEEYALILVDTTKENAKIVANRIVKSIETFHFNQDNNHTRMTISVGLAEFPMDSDLGKGLIEKADAAMYEAKKIGGNSFCVAQTAKEKSS